MVLFALKNLMVIYHHFKHLETLQLLYAPFSIGQHFKEYWLNFDPEPALKNWLGFLLLATVIENHYLSLDLR